MPKASIIIPTYNRSTLLQSSIHSIFSQTYGDFEVIIIDDGSVDDTASIVAQFTDCRLRYIYQPNQGLPAARNTGLRSATGEYVGFLDSDDLYLPHFLESLTRFLDENPSIGLVAGGSHYIDSEGAHLGTACPWKFTACFKSCRQPVVHPDHLRGKEPVGSGVRGFATRCKHRNIPTGSDN